MTHPALGQHYQYVFETELGWRYWSGWHICRPETALADMLDGIAHYKSVHPSYPGKLLWRNPKGDWQEVTLGSPVESKYALFSED